MVPEDPDRDGGSGTSTAEKYNAKSNRNVNSSSNNSKGTIRVNLSAGEKTHLALRKVAMTSSLHSLVARDIRSI